MPHGQMCVHCSDGLSTDGFSSCALITDGFGINLFNTEEIINAIYVTSISEL